MKSLKQLLSLWQAPLAARAAAAAGLIGTLSVLPPNGPTDAWQCTSLHFYKTLSGAYGHDTVGTFLCKMNKSVAIKNINLHWTFASLHCLWWIWLHMVSYIKKQSMDPKVTWAFPESELRGSLGTCWVPRFKAPITCTVCVAFSQVPSHSNTHIVGLLWSVPTDHTDNSVVCRVPFKLMLSGRA